TPGRAEGTGWVLVPRHPALVADIERRHDHGPAGLGDPLAQALEIVAADVERPRGRLIGCHGRSDPGGVVAIDPRDRVPVVLRIRVHLDVPSEEPGIEL